MAESRWKTQSGTYATLPSDTTCGASAEPAVPLCTKATSTPECGSASNLTLASDPPVWRTSRVIP